MTAAESEREFAWAARVQRLEAQLAGTRRAMRVAAVIEQAKGFLAATLSITPDAAYEHLKRLSNHENVRVVEVAARLIGAALPDVETDAPPEAATGFDPATYRVHSDPAQLAEAEPAAAASTGLPTPLRVRLQTAVAAIDSASDPVELAARIRDEGAGWLAVESVMIYLTEPDGALRLLGQSGLPPQQASDWQRIPSAVDVPVRAAIRADKALFEVGDTSGQSAFVVASRGRASLPLRYAGRTVGGLALAWAQPRVLDADEQRYLTALAAALSRRLPVIVAAADLAPTQHWLTSVLDSVPAALVLLAPVRSATGEITDFVIDHVNPTAADLLGAESAALVGRQLLDVRPGLAIGDVFDAYRSVAQTGVGWQRAATPETQPASGAAQVELVSRSAARLGDGLLVSWQNHDARIAHADQIERTGQLGFAWRDLTSGGVTWSPEVYRLFGRSPERGPVPVDQLARQFPGADLARLQSAYRRMIESGTPIDMLVRLTTTDGPRQVLVRATTEGQPVTAVFAVLQDVTDLLIKVAAHARAERSAPLRRVAQGRG